MSANILKRVLLLIGDIVILYASLFVALILRYGTTFYEQFIDIHVGPFTIIFIPWLIIFYIAGLYDLRRLRNNLDFLKIISIAIATSALFAMLLFYLIPAFGIAPKTNLLIFIVIFAILEFIWRQLFNRTMSFGEAPNKVVLVGGASTTDEIVRTIQENPQLGYAIVERINEHDITTAPGLLEKAVAKNHANIVAVPQHFKTNEKLALILYKLFGKGMLVIGLPHFYELIMRKVPLSDVEESWFLENIQGTAKFYEPLKRAAELLEALILGIVLLPFEILIAIIIKLTSRGPVLIRQQRVGQLGNVFTLYKFRSMVALSADGQAETQGAQWAAQGDKRVTPFGKLLRASHLDELPQLLNIIRGEVSFVGPRPERPEFVEKLKEQVPYYEVRLLVKPGITGWAQINYRADQTLDDVKQKLQYDIYYLKNRSLILDVAIVLKTIKSIFVNPQ